MTSQAHRPLNNLYPPSIASVPVPATSPFCLDDDLDLDCPAVVVALYLHVRWPVDLDFTPHRPMRSLRDGLQPHLRVRAILRVLRDPATTENVANGSMRRLKLAIAMLAEKLRSNDA
eukprot:CAMPEP_0198664796 /NCGR_PEP_ID=MMETSP1467-20131203/57613_1 /TAXON_ID=1462469 /ORGANISM="unid. sp., Strain CCMP2135" /LENGTH=116 /DNA_ID=CAMNT_0044401377 /DNA_START=86 /DNA_END=435 /DNA_ORIENTATION=+